MRYSSGTTKSTVNAVCLLSCSLICVTAVQMWVCLVVKNMHANICRVFFSAWVCTVNVFFRADRRWMFMLCPLEVFHSQNNRHWVFFGRNGCCENPYYAFFFFRWLCGLYAVYIQVCSYIQYCEVIEWTRLWAFISSPEWCYLRWLVPL